MLDEPNNIQIKEHEILNIEIPFNKAKFLKYFSDILDEKILFKKKYNEKNLEKPLFIIKSEETNEINQDPVIMINNDKSNIDNYTKMILDIDLSIEETRSKKFYYYKRF